MSLLLVAVLGACGGDDKPDASIPSTTTVTTNIAADAVDTPNVAVKGFAFDPKVARVKAGDKVTWTNEEPDDDHKIHDDAAGVRGPAFGPKSSSKTFARTFATPGTYPYYCGLHNSMSGTIIVT